jgi:hypothetical protein
MAGRTAWIERTFDFEFPVGLYHEILERLRGTPARVEERVRALPAETVALTPGPARPPWD